MFRSALKACRPVGAIEGEIVADFEETRQFRNFTKSEIKRAWTCSFIQGVIGDNTLRRKEPGSQSRIRDVYC